jgi:DNA ligase-1
MTTLQGGATATPSEFFPLLNTMLNDLNSTNSANDKMDILRKKYNIDVMKRALVYTYDPMRLFNVTKAQIIKYGESHSELLDEMEENKESPHKYKTVFDLLDALSSRAITGHDALKCIHYFMRKKVAEEYRDDFLNMIDKDLKLRIKDKQINKVWDNLIPTFSVALGESFEKKEDYFNKTRDKENTDWYISRKLDGVRCLARVNIASGGIVFRSRLGKEFETLTSRGKELIRDFIPAIAASKTLRDAGDIVIDGELCVIDEKGQEDFKGVLKQLKKKGNDALRVRFMVFDILTGQEFDSQTSDENERTFEKRISAAKKVFSRYNEVTTGQETTRFMTLLKQKVFTPETFAEKSAEADANGWEGLMVRMDAAYVGKRSRDILKVKKFQTEEYKVESLKLGAPPNTGLNDMSEEVVTAFIINHKGNNVSVGSGLSINERREFAKCPANIVGKMISVQYFEETKDDKTGLYSLRFPTFKGVYGKKRDM